jgi:hypothetical protein
MKREPPLHIDLPPLSDKTVGEIHRFLAAVAEAFESRYALQLWRYYDNNPRLPRPLDYHGQLNLPANHSESYRTAQHRRPTGYGAAQLK